MYLGEIGLPVFPLMFQFLTVILPIIKLVK